MHEKLKRYFEDNDISQQQVADILGVSLQYVNGILNGKKSLGKKNAERLANLFGLSKSFLLTGDGEIRDGGQCKKQKVEPAKIQRSNIDHASLMNAALSAKDETIASLQREMATKEELIASLRSEIEAKDDHIATLKDRLAHLRRVIDEHGLLKAAYPFPMGSAETQTDLP